MKLYVFNPEHDIALAHGSPLFTAPKAGRQLRADLGFLPVLWAEKGGIVWVDSPGQALWLAKQVGVDAPEAMFVDSVKLRHLANRIDSVEPWGWDAALCHALRRHGVSPSVLPTPKELETLRLYSHRNQSKVFLKQLKSIILSNSIVGDSVEVNTEDKLEQLLKQWPSAVLKAPWSSSGRGVRMVAAPLNEAILRWVGSVLRHQGSLMVEPKYDKLIDFGMEFSADSTGVSYVGLSLFDTSGTAYTGNLLASEREKMEMLGRHIDLRLVTAVRDAILLLFPKVFSLFHYGPFGVDMMVVRGDEGTPKIHPCVEINFRRTMGHVAIALDRQKDAGFRTMKVLCDEGHYHLRIR